MPDLLGFGSSPEPRVRYTVQEHLSSLHASFEDAGVGPPAIRIGHSRGALLAVAYARAHPGSASARVLVSRPLLPEGSTTRDRIEEEYGHGRPTAWLACFLRRVHQMTGRPARPIARRYRLELPAAAADDAMRHTWESFRGALDSVTLGPSPLPYLGELRGTPVVVVVGRDDPFVDVNQLRALAEAAGAPLHVLDGSHHVLLEDPGAREVVLQFIRSLAPGGPGLP